MRIKEVRVGGFVWRLLPEAESLIPYLGPNGVHLNRLEAITVKHTRHRTVQRVKVGALDFHVKHYHGDLRDWFRVQFRGRRAAREFALSREVARRGVPTIEVLAFGERANGWGGSESVLLTNTLPDARPLLDFLECDLPNLPAEQRLLMRRQLAGALGTLIAQQHRAGIRHDDLHPGNVLLRFEGDEPRLFLIDLDSVHLGPTMNWADSRNNLVVLDRWFAQRFSRVDRWCAWKAYLAVRTDLQLPARLTARSVAEITQSSWIQQMRQFDRRCLGGNRHYRRVRGGLCVADLDAEFVKELFNDPEAIFRAAEGKEFKKSASSAVIEIHGGDKSRAMLCKRFTATWKDVVASWFRSSPALRSYVLGHGLRLRGLPTPRPLAVWHPPRFGLRQNDYLLMEKLPNAIHLRAFVEQVTSRQRRWDVLDQLARLIRRMHDAGVSHRDLKAANVLISDLDYAMSVRGLREIPSDPKSPRDRVWFVDLVGVRLRGKVGKLRRVKDLARLQMSFLEHPAVSRTDRLRFLRTYLNWGICGKVGWKTWWHEIDKAARVKVIRNLTRGRVIG